MNKYLRVGTVITATALLASPLAANADRGIELDGPEAGPTYADITSISANHKLHRINTTLNLAKINKNRLARTQVRIQRKGARKIWTATIRRNSHGKVTSKMLSVKKPDGPTGIVLGCGKIRTGVQGTKVRVSVPTGCIVGKHQNKRVRVKGRAVGVKRSGGIAVATSDSTPFTTYLARG